MDDCQNCGAALPIAGGRFCPHCGEAIRRDELGMSQTHQAAPSPVHAAVPGDQRSSYDSLAGPYVPPGYGQPDGGYGPQGTSVFDAVQPTQATQAIPAAGGVPEEDPFEAYFRPPPGEPSPHTMTQVIPAIPQQQPAYDQPIHYQGAPGQPYPQPYADGHGGHGGPGGYEGEPDDSRNDGRNTKIAIGVAVVAVVVIIISLITIGGSKNTATTQPSLGPTTVLRPTSSAPAAPDTSAAQSSSAAPTTTSSSSAPKIPGALQMGDTGADVKWLQNRLKQLHFYNGPASGKFDQATADAVQAFQAQAHTADPASVVGRSTKTALIAWGSKPAMSLIGDGGLRHRVASADVKRLQQALTVALGKNVAASGKYDVATATAVASYESAIGALPDGTVNDQVWSALQSGKLAN